MNSGQEIVGELVVLDCYAAKVLEPFLPDTTMIGPILEPSKIFGGAPAGARGIFMVPI